MMTFNKILNPVYSTIESFSLLDDGAINAKYVVGTGNDNGDGMTDFVAITSEYKYIDSENAKSITEAQLTKDDTGKTPIQIMLDRIYTYLKDKGEIIV